MTAKEYLMQIRDIRSDIKLCKKERAIVEETTGSDSEEARKLQEKLKQEIAEYCRLESEIREKILALPNNKYKTLLIGYYINCMTLEEVADLMERDFDYIRHLHGWAIEYFRKFYGFKKKI